MININESLTRRVWRALNESDVPNAGQITGASIKKWVNEINGDIKNHSYIPGIVDGYLGIEKN